MHEEGAGPCMLQGLSAKGCPHSQQVMWWRYSSRRGWEVMHNALTEHMLRLLLLQSLTRRAIQVKLQESSSRPSLGCIREAEAGAPPQLPSRDAESAGVGTWPTAPAKQLPTGGCKADCNAAGLWPVLRPAAAEGHILWPFPRQTAAEDHDRWPFPRPAAAEGHNLLPFPRPAAAGCPAAFPSGCCWALGTPQVALLLVAGQRRRGQVYSLGPRSTKQQPMMCIITSTTDVEQPQS